MKNRHKILRSIVMIYVCLSSRITRENDTAELHQIFVHVAFRGKPSQHLAQLSLAI